MQRGGSWCGGEEDRAAAQEELECSGWKRLTHIEEETSVEDTFDHVQLKKDCERRHPARQAELSPLLINYF